jgi:hypothetical protein
MSVCETVVSEAHSTRTQGRGGMGQRTRRQCMRARRLSTRCGMLAEGIDAVEQEKSRKRAHKDQLRDKPTPFHRHGEQSARQDNNAAWCPPHLQRSQKNCRRLGHLSLPNWRGSSCE